MYAFSSAFFSTFPKSSSSISPTLTPNLPLLSVSYVRIVDKATTTTARPPPPPNPQALKKLKQQTGTPSSSSVADQKPATKKRPQGIGLSFPSLLLNAVDNFINNFVDPPSRPSVNPKYVLSGNFAPVHELPPTECEVSEGSLPPCLDGAYIRNGPNPQHLPRGPYHLFDGDGMLHSLRISKGKATLCSRFVQTYKYKIEREIGSPVVPNVFSGFNGLTASAARGALSAARIATGQFNPINGFGLANTSLALIGGSLYALGESDLPYTVKLAPDGDIVTLGRHDFDGKLIMSMTAHPKIDPETGEAFAFKYGPMPPFLTFFRISPDGKKQPDVPIFSMKRPSFLHDFAVTKKYAIFPDIQIGMNPLEMIAGGSFVGTDPGKVPRLGVIPRYAVDESEMRWFNVSGFNIMHAINAWDEDDGESIVLVAPNILSIDHTLERMDLIHASIEKLKIDLKTCTVSRLPLSTRNLDFAVINPAYVGKKNKYLYAGIGDPWPKISGVAKLDITVTDSDRRDCIVGSRMFGEGCFGGEPFFVAKEANNDVEGEEDDGYVVSYVHNEKTGESRFLVMDAKSPNLETVAAVKLPQRVRICRNRRPNAEDLRCCEVRHNSDGQRPEGLQPDVCGGEPFFVAKEANNNNNVDGEEDDGYVVSYVHNEKTGESRFLVMDAKSPNLEIVAVVKLPQRAPYGFHGLFIRETDLN